MNDTSTRGERKEDRRERETTRQKERGGRENQPTETEDGGSHSDLRVSCCSVASKISLALMETGAPN